MTSPVYCTGRFIGLRILDSSIHTNTPDQKQLELTLCFTPTKRYPSAFGAGFYDTNGVSCSIIHGTYYGTTRQASLIEHIDGTATYEYQLTLTFDKSHRATYLHGSWKSLLDSNLFGKLTMICESDDSSHCLSGIWTGEAA
jgi:hypothetical protein